MIAPGSRVQARTEEQASDGSPVAAVDVCGDKLWRGS